MTPISVGCYGKLPIHGDFIRYNVGAAEISVLDRWFQEGLFAGQKQLGGQFSDVFDRAPASRFVFSMPSIGRIVVGVIMPGCDKTGRQFPFLVAAGTPVKDFGLEVALIPGIFESFFERAHAVMKDWIGKDLKSFLGRVEQLSFQLDVRGEARRVAQSVARRTINMGWTDAFGATADVRKYLLLQNLADVLKPKVLPKYALRFPATSNGGNAAVWLELTQKLLARAGLPTMTMWNFPQDDVAPQISLLFDDLRDRYLLPLLNPDRDSDVAYRLGRYGPGDDAKLAQARQRYGALADNVNLTVPELIQRMP